MNPYASEPPYQSGDDSRSGPYGHGHGQGYGNGQDGYGEDENPYRRRQQGRDRARGRDKIDPYAMPGNPAAPTAPANAYPQQQMPPYAPPQDQSAYPGYRTQSADPTRPAYPAAPMKQPPTTFAPPVPSSPRITPQTVAAAEKLGYDPTAVNAPVIRRFSALLVDMAIYLAAAAGIVGFTGILGGVDAAAIVTVVLGILGPVGFYGYRAAGDAVFEGSPGKRMLGLTMGEPHELPVSGGAAMKRNVWMLVSVIPVLGWLVSLGMMIWIAVGISGDPLGRGPHEKAAGTRVIETPPKEVRERKALEQKQNKEELKQLQRQRKQDAKGKKGKKGKK